MARGCGMYPSDILNPCRKALSLLGEDEEGEVHNHALSEGDTLQ